MSRAPVIETKALEKKYPRSAEGSEVAALVGISITVEEGERVALVGPSGSGKSTLLNLIGALDVPTAGEVKVLGRSLGALDDAAKTRLRRDEIGFVFQAFNLMPTLSALENVMLPRLLAGVSGSALKKSALEKLEAVGLSARASHLPDALSGGEMQRVAIARALLSNPKLVLADEPTGNLDSESGAAVISLLLGEASRSRTLLLVTHDARLAARCDRIVHLADGRIDERAS